MAARVAEQCLGLRSRKLCRMVTRIFDEALRELNLTATQFTLLAATAVKVSVRAGDLAAYLDMEKSTLSRNLNRLTERGLLVLAPGADARERQVSLTAAGEETLAQAFPAWQLAQEDVTALLGKEARTSLDAMLST